MGSKECRLCAVTVGFVRLSRGVATAAPLQYQNRMTSTMQGDRPSMVQSQTHRAQTHKNVISHQHERQTNPTALLIMLRGAEVHTTCV